MYLSIFSPNARKYGPEKTPYSDTFHAVIVVRKYVTKPTKTVKNFRLRLLYPSFNLSKMKGLSNMNFNGIRAKAIV